MQPGSDHIEQMQADASALIHLQPSTQSKIKLSIAINKLSRSAIYLNSIYMADIESELSEALGLIRDAKAILKEVAA